MLLNMVYFLFSLSTGRMKIKRVVGYASRSLTEKEQRYSQIEKEALAVL